MRLFFSRFQLDLEVGLGSATGRVTPWGEREAQSLTPMVMLQWSNDSGHTWSEEHWVEAGRLGRYRHRAIWRRLGLGRNRTWRITMTEPIAWRLLDAYVDVDKGTS